MSDAQSQLAEVDALIAASPDDPSLLTLREDLLQLIALEEQEKSGGAAVLAEQNSELQNEQLQQQSVGEQHSLAQHVGESSEKNSYTAQSSFTDNVATNSLAAEAPDLGSAGGGFQPVAKSNYKSATTTIVPQANLKSGEDDADDNGESAAAAAESNSQTNEKKKKKKKKKSEDLLSTTFELPNHLIPLDSDTPAQKQKKHRAGKTLKSKFRSQQKEVEHAKRANDWKSFSSKTSKKKKVSGKSIFSTEEGVNAKVGVISGGSGRAMTGFSEQGKHKF